MSLPPGGRGVARRSAVLAALLLAGCRGGSPQARTPAPSESVSVGYGTESKANGTGAVTSITPTEADTRVGRMEDLLAGRVPGLEILVLSGGTISLRLRGQGTIAGAENEPLLVVDDVAIPQGSVGAALAALAPRDVARIDVLRDAASTAIYGTRGANGVIIITTKRRAR